VSCVHSYPPRRQGDQRSKVLPEPRDSAPRVWRGEAHGRGRYWEPSPCRCEPLQRGLRLHAQGARGRVGLCATRVVRRRDRPGVARPLHANGALVAEGAVRVGDTATSETGATKRVVSVSGEQARGLFDPQTLDGDIVVEGLLASTYTTIVEPALAHAALAPMRLFYQVFGVATSVDSQGRTFSGVSSSEVILSCSN
jgi:hypothetical protein